MIGLSPLTLVVRAIVLLTTIPVHEAAHAWAADRMGDPTARYKGRLTLNPMAHFDLVGSVALLLTGIGWAKPVPINPINFDDSKKGMALSAAAGPAANLCIATLSMMIMKFILYAGGWQAFYSSTFTGSLWSTFYYLFSTMCSINISLAIFNLMPFPPFDGSRIFNYFLPDKYYFKIMEYERYIFIGLLLVLYMGLLDRPLSFLSGIVYFALDKLTFFLDKLFMIIF